MGWDMRWMNSKWKSMDESWWVFGVGDGYGLSTPRIHGGGGGSFLNIQLAWIQIPANFNLITRKSLISFTSENWIAYIIEL
jgi:hypothetical protein